MHNRERRLQSQYNLTVVGFFFGFGLFVFPFAAAVADPALFLIGSGVIILAVSKWIADSIWC